VRVKALSGGLYDFHHIASPESALFSKEVLGFPVFFKRLKWTDIASYS
jgi:hypothetical protein